MPARKAKPSEPQPDLTVSAIVRVFVHEGGCAELDIKVDAEGRSALVGLMTQSSGKLNIAGAALRRVVMQALSVHMEGPPTDMLAVAAKAGRA